MSERPRRRAIIVLVLLQAAVLLALPLLAGPRIPSGKTVQLAASERDAEKRVDRMPNELLLDYGLDELELPDDVGFDGMVYVELHGGTDGPARFGRVVSNEGELPDGATWIRLPVYGVPREVGAGAIEAWFEEDRDRVDELRDHLEEDPGNRLLVTVELDNDGDPTISDVEPG